MRKWNSSRMAGSELLFRLIGSVLVLITTFQVTSALENPECPTVFWNFGDSFTDAGSLVNSFPLCPQCDSLSSPYGDTFFERPAKRFTNGRVVPDFFVCAEFLRFLPVDDSYLNGLYTLGFGGNDIFNALVCKNMTADEITTQVIPEAMTAVAKGIETLYKNGARQFLFFNLQNGGCGALEVTLLGTILPTDASGCVIVVNSLFQAFSAALNATIASARIQYPTAFFTIFNYYVASEEILFNPNKYGLDPKVTQPACCGAPGVGTLNFNPYLMCGNPGTTKCSNPEKNVNWDGIHFTDAFCRLISKFALNGS